MTVLDRRPRAPSPAGPEARGLARDAAVVVGTLLALAVVAGLLWPQLVDPVEFVRTQEGVVTDEVALAHRSHARSGGGPVDQSERLPRLTPPSRPTGR